MPPQAQRSIRTKRAELAKVQALCLYCDLCNPRGRCVQCWRRLLQLRLCRRQVLLAAQLDVSRRERDSTTRMLVGSVFTIPRKRRRRRVRMLPATRRVQKSLCWCKTGTLVCRARSASCISWATLRHVPEYSTARKQDEGTKQIVFESVQAAHRGMGGIRSGTACCGETMGAPALVWRCSPLWHAF